MDYQLWLFRRYQYSMHNMNFITFLLSCISGMRIYMYSNFRLKTNEAFIYLEINISLYLCNEKKRSNMKYFVSFLCSWGWLLKFIVCQKIAHFGRTDSKSICDNFKALSLILSGVEVDSFRFIIRILIPLFWRAH